MTGISADDSRLLVLFGEMRGDLKSLLRQQEELNERLRVSEETLHERISKLDARVKSLEAIRLRVAGFATAMGALAAILGSKLGAAAAAFSKLIGG